MLRILIIDDDDAGRIRTTELLTGAGYRVEAHPECDDVLGALASFEPDVLLLGLPTEPRGAWSDVTPTLQCLTSCPTIVVSTTPREDRLTFARRVGAVAELGRPVSPDRLLELVRAAARDPEALRAQLEASRSHERHRTAELYTLPRPA